MSQFQQPMKITFAGATDTVTGSKHIITTEDGQNILLDCGLYQGRSTDTDFRNRNFSFDPASIDVVILSHAHIDHSGNLPLLVKKGFTGKIFCTPGTFDLCVILLKDSAHIHANDVFYLNKKRKKNGQEPLEPLYEPEDVDQCLSQFETIKYDQWFSPVKHFKFMFSDAGHILGSAVVNMELNEKKGLRKLCFSGDIGRKNNLLLTPFKKYQETDYLICESTYGDRNHEDVKEPSERLLEIIKRTCVTNGGKLLIPAFSLGRTQEIIFTLNNLKNKNLLPDIPVFVDSPLSTNATDILRKHKSSLNEGVKEVLKTDNDPFGFNNLTYIQEVEDSIRLNELKEPCIIISASGMLEAGRIKHHLKNNIHDKNSCLLIVGYCAAETLGGRLKSGAKKVKIFGEEYPVKIRVETIEDYSGHAGRDELIDFVKMNPVEKTKGIFLVHGEDESKIAFKALLEYIGYTKVIIPKNMQEFQL